MKNLSFKSRKFIVDNRLNLINHFKTGKTFIGKSNFQLNIFLFKEKRRLSRGEITLNVPSVGNERGRRMSRHDALALTSSNKILPDANQSISNN